MKINKFTAFAVTAVLTVSGGAVTVASATAANGQDTVCVPSPEIPATPGTPEVPAVPGTPEVPAVPGTPDIEAQHYSLKGGSKLEKDGVPPTPQENPDIWQANAPQEPVGHHTSATDDDGSAYLPGEYGLHFTSAGNDDKGEGKRDWFYFQPFVAGTPGTPAIPATPGTPAIPAVPGTPAVPAVVCPETPTETPTPTTPTETPSTPTETPSVPTPTVTPEVPVETPTETPTPEVETPENETPVKNPPKSTPQPPKDVQVVECVDGVFVTSVNGEVISEAGSCEVREGNDEPVTFSETGL